MSTVYMWSGALTPTGARVVAKVTGSSTRLAVSTSAAMTSPTYFGPAVPSSSVVSISATGLTAATQYYYAMEDDSTLDTAKVGRFRTLPTAGSEASFTVVASGCAGASGSPYIHSPGVSNSPIFDTIRVLDPDILAHLGDRNYGNVNDNDVPAFQDVYDRVMAAPRQEELYRNVPTVYAWDDHDFGDNNSDGSEASRPAVSQVYRERVPSYTLPAGSGDNPIYHSFEVGRILFIVSDTRWARVPGATMLGAAQKTWMEGVLTASTAEAFVWLCPTPWMGLSDDTWAGYTSERDELAEMFEATGWMDRMVCIVADYHGLGMDTGTGNLALTGASFPVWLWASLDSPGSGTPGGVTTQYDQGPTSPGADRYGVLEVVDEGAFIHLTGTGYIGSTPWNSHTLHVQTEASGDAIPERSLSLTYDEVLSRVRVNSAEIEGPDTYSLLEDMFTRSVSNGWGTATSGQAWANSGGAASDYSVNGTAGLVTHTDVNVRRFTTADSYTDVDLIASVDCPSTPTGANVIAGLVARYVDTNNAYHCWIVFSTTGALTLTISKRIAGTFTTVATAALVDTHTPGTPMWIRFTVRGTSLTAKAWKDGNPEPAALTLAGTDSDLVDPGPTGTHSVRLTSNTNTNLGFKYDNLATQDPPPVTITVERSLNEVTWTTVRGGNAREVTTGTDLTVDDYEFTSDTANYYRVSVYDSLDTLVATDTGIITPELGTPWLKSISRPFLNRALTGPIDVSEISRPARNGVFDIVGRTYAVAVTDIRGGRQVVVTVLTDSPDRRRDLDLMLASGDPVFLHMPAGRFLSSMYAVVGDSADRLVSPGNTRDFFSLPLIEVAAPGPDVVGATSTYQSVRNAYATYTDLRAANETYGDLRELIGSPDDVIVG